MINTLFYFVDDPTFNYQAAVNNGDISEYTVVFNSADKCIYAKNTVFSKVTRVDVANTLGDISDILPAATSSKLGGVKIGYSSDDKRYGLKLDSNNRAYVEVPWTDTIAPAYDDTGILDDLDAQRQRIDQYINNLTTTIKEYNETLFDDAQWVVNNLTAGQVGRQINENIDEYFRQQYGVWDWVDPNDHTKGKVIRTSVIEQNVDSIDLRVGSVEDYKDGYLTTALSNLEQTVGVDLETGETTAGTNLINSVQQLDADTNNIVKMAASALQLKSSKNGNALNSTADLASVIVNGQFTGYSGLNETVSNQGDAITAQSSLMSRVVNSNGTPNSAFKADVIAGLASTTYVDDKTATAKTEAIAAASTNTTNAVAGLASEVYVDNKVASAQSTLQASIDGVSSSLTLKVGKDSNGNIESSAKISASQIYLSGTTWADVINANSIVTGILTAGSATFTGTVNATSGNFSGDITIRRSSSSSDGLKLDSDGNIQRYNAAIGDWVPLYAGRAVRVENRSRLSSPRSLYSSDDFVLFSTTDGWWELPTSGIVNGKILSLRNTAGGTNTIRPGSGHTIRDTGGSHTHSDTGRAINNDERAELVFYNNVWYLNVIGT